ncbi:MAG: glucose-6-phosphate dehydrogenase assembly protein OpcA [Candidatus Eremiobacteraeota bacterium]|nr:glucose-6-phosphate dehydrogenase assembly protein OpcA [Candidatus Eremiobacteraeota bacterium]
MSVDVAAIQDQLQRSRSQSSGVTATTMNFIAYIDDTAHRAWVMERTIALADKHACRALILDATATSGEASVFTSLQEATEAIVRAERIELQIARISPEQVRTIAHSLSAPGVPSILWWTSDSITRNEHFGALNEIVDSLVVDSSGLNASDDALKEFIDYFTCEKRIKVRDLAYMRLLPWQDIIAQFFDHKEFIEDLFSICEVEIVSGSDAEALYLIGWLAGRLEWRACKRSELCTKNGDTIRFVQLRAGDLRRIRKVTLTSKGSRFVAEVQSACEDTVCLWVEGAKARDSRCAPLQKIDNISLLEKAILTPHADEVFATSLEMAQRLVQS